MFDLLSCAGCRRSLRCSGLPGPYLGVRISQYCICMGLYSGMIQSCMRSSGRITSAMAHVPPGDFTSHQQ